MNEEELEKDSKKETGIRLYIRSVIFLLGLGLFIWICNFSLIGESYVKDMLAVVHRGYDLNEDGTKMGDEVGFDTVILGGSHGRSAIDPKVVDEVLDTNSVNLCIPGETVKDSYYLLLEAAKTNDIKRVILDVDYQYYLGDQTGAGFDRAFIYYQLPWNSYVKWKYMIEDSNTLDVRNAISMRNNYKFSPDYIRDNVKYKLTVNNNRNIHKLREANGQGPYMGKGFYYIPHFPFNENFGDCHTYDFDKKVHKVPRKNFEKIKKFCDDNGIELICAYAPIPNESRARIDINKVHETMSNFFKEYNANFIDFNMLDSSILDCSKDGYLDAEGHMCGEFADKYSLVLSNSIKSLQVETCEELTDEIYGKVN
ncbi:hypothetical protein [Lachnospira multipara]|uniref:hypothetical protein n=1 Tax=Lachnospira multipara TaxID=28051 RepID=UPI00048272CD|nr:hypothetical protein [Lachnospira multipara]